MNIADLLSPRNVALDLRVADKRRLLDELGRRMSEEAGLDGDAIAEALAAREQLGSTGMGSGIAIPHARLPSLDRPLGSFARLRSPVDFDAIDGLRVDLAFLLLLPAQAQGEQLNALACVARRLRDEGAKAALRKARDPGEAYAVLCGRDAV